MEQIIIKNLTVHFTENTNHTLVVCGKQMTNQESVKS